MGRLLSGYAYHREMAHIITQKRSAYWIFMLSDRQSVHFDYSIFDRSVGETISIYLRG